MAKIARRELLKTGFLAGSYFAGGGNLHSLASAVPAANFGAGRRVEFSRMLDDWVQYTDPRFLSLVDQVQPQVAQVGFYGVDFWALGHVPFAVKGKTQWPEPVDGNLSASGEFLQHLNQELHSRGIKAVGHFDIGYHVTGLIDGPQGPREGFFKFYNDLWEENALGPKPVQDPLELLQRKADGSPVVIPHLAEYSPWPIYHACLNNPQWRTVLKAFVKRAVERRVDGFIINYIYTNGCMCQYCVQGLKTELHQRYSRAELRMRFGIDDLEKYDFAEIYDGYTAGKMTPLRLEQVRFSDLSRKRLVDEVFLQYGRSLKPDLLLAQWMHCYQPKSQNDERLLLPPELWARGETYMWYSLGYYAVGYPSATLQLRYLRGAGGGRPYSVRYGPAQSRVLRSELAANGGVPNVRHPDLKDADLRQELGRYFAFMEQHADVFEGSKAAGECVLLHPRSQVQQGLLPQAVETYLAVGERLLNDHILFDVLPDDLATPDLLAPYRRVYTNSSLPDMEGESYDGLSRFDAPATVRVSASRSQKGDVWDIHFVNYNYQGAENKSHAGEGKADKPREIPPDDPVPVADVKADLAVPTGFSVSKVAWITPESADPHELSFDKIERRVHFRTPEFLVYGVARVYLTRMAVKNTAG